MEDLGFVCVDGSKKADYLTEVTVPTEREVAPRYKNKFLRTSDDVAAAYDQSKTKTFMLEEAQSFPESEEARVNTMALQDLVAKEKNKGLRDSPVSVNFFKQAQFEVMRQYQLISGNKSTMVIKQVAALIQALIDRSLF